MSTKTTKPKKSKVATVGRSRAARPGLPIEDDERHLPQGDDYVSRNRDALNASIQRSRKEISEGKVSSKSIETIIAAVALYLFLVHTFTARDPFVRPSLFRDRNFAAGILFVAIVGLTYYASLALQPPYLQHLMNYPIVSAT